MILSEIMNVMENIAPKELAEEWDNPGLMIGDVNLEIDKIIVALDVDRFVADEAIRLGADLIITHHPLIFKPIKSINNKLFLDLIKNNISVFSAHTNLDSAKGGVNDVLADVLKLKNVSENGIMRIGETEDKSLMSFAHEVAQALKTPSVRVAGNLQSIISRVGVLGGSGDDFLPLAKETGCDCFVTGEASYHDALTADELGISLITAGHFETESPVVPVLADRLKLMLNGVTVYASKRENPYNLI